MSPNHDVTATAIRRIAVYGGPIEAPVHHSTIILRGLRGPLIMPPLCRKTQVCQAANVRFSSLEFSLVPREAEWILGQDSWILALHNSHNVIIIITLLEL